MSSLGEQYPKEQARVRELLGEYKKIGAAGVFGATLIEDTLRRADEAAVSGDVVAMLRLLGEMRKLE
jgi:hypothetical protein